MGWMRPSGGIMNVRASCDVPTLEYGADSPRGADLGAVGWSLHEAVPVATYSWAIGILLIYE